MTAPNPLPLYTIPAPPPPDLAYPVPQPRPDQTPYPVPEPQNPAALYILSMILVIGLIALFIAAVFAFEKTQPLIQAIFSAMLIEAGAIGEAFAIIKRRNRIAIAGLAVSIIVSGTYNYIQSKYIGETHGLTDPWQLWTLSLGPLAALVFLALSTGHELNEHEQDREKWQTARTEHQRTQTAQNAAALAQWQTARQTWIETQTAAHAAALAQWQANRQTWIENEIHRQERREDKRRKLTGNLPETYRPILPETSPQPNGNGTQPHPETNPAPTPIYTDYRKIPEEIRRKLSEMETRDIKTTFRLNNPKTAYNWQQAARAEFPPVHNS